jgi:hypothetical protein
MSERLGRRGRRRGLNAGQLRLEATYADYTSVARTVPLHAAVLDAELWDAARRAFSLANTKRLAVRSVSLTLDRLMETEAQLDLWAGQRSGGADGQQKHTSSESLSGADCPTAPLPRCPVDLQHALDQIHRRWGMRGVTRGVARPLSRPSMNAAAAGMPTGAPLGGPVSGLGDPLGGLGDPFGDLDDPGLSHANHS